MKRYVPHAAILTVNMYIVFFLIDRVNQSMNFIDNGMTRALLLLQCLFGVYDLLRIRAQSRIRAVPALEISNAVLMLFYLPVFLIASFNQWSLIMTGGFVKFMLLLMSFSTAVNAIRLIAYDRTVLRRYGR